LRTEMINDDKYLIWELIVREGSKEETSNEIFCEYCKTFKTVNVILSYNKGLPLKIVLNKGIRNYNSIEFNYKGRDNINCKDTNNCPKK